MVAVKDTRNIDYKRGRWKRGKEERKKGRKEGDYKMQTS